MAKKAYIGADNFTRRELPSGYMQVEYIESRGTQYIDTGFNPNQNTGVTMDFEVTDTSVTSWLFCGRTSASAGAYGVYAYTGGSSFYFVYGAGRTDFSGTTAQRQICTVDKNKCTIQETTVTIDAQTFTSSATLCLLVRNTNGTLASFARAKIYSCRIYDNGTLIRDYVPCLNVSGAAGLYDMVNGVFYGNAGTGSFTVGAVYASGVARKIKRDYIGIDDVARRVKKAYIGIGGVARPWQVSDEVVYYGRITNLSNKKTGLVGAMVGNYALFGGGRGYPDEDGNDVFFYTVDAYDASLTKRSPANLNDDGVGMAATTLGDNALIGGGCYWYEDGTYVYHSTVNVYNKSLTKSANKSLSTARTNLAATTAGNYAFFAGGVTYVEPEYAEYEDDTYYTTVDAFNTSLTRSNPTELNEGLNRLAGATAGNYAIFGGGDKRYGGKTYANAYDQSLTRTIINSTEFGSYAYIYNAASVGDYAIFAGNQTVAFDKSLTAHPIQRHENKHGTINTATTLKNYALFITEKFWLISYDQSLTLSVAAHASGNERSGMAAATVGDFALFAGGYKYDSSYDRDEYYSYVEAFQYIKGD